MKKLSIKAQKNLLGFLTALTFLITGIIKHFPEIVNAEIVGICSAILCIIFLIFLVRVLEKMNSLNVLSSGSSLKEITITDGRKIKVNTSDKICALFGFLHDDIVIKPDGVEATIQGVGPGNDGEDVLWYIIDWNQVNAPNGKGGASYWGGDKFLPNAGFIKKSV